MSPHPLHRRAKLFAKDSSLGGYNGDLGASVGVRFGLPAGGPFDRPIPQVDGPTLPPSYRSGLARILASITGAKCWLYHSESWPGECRGDVWLFPIWARPPYGQEPADLMSEFPASSAMRRKKRNDSSFYGPHEWSAHAGNTHWLNPTALPKTAISPWFPIDNFHYYDIHVGVRVETDGYWLPRLDRYTVAIAELEAVVQSITIQFSG